MFDLSSALACRVESIKYLPFGSKYLLEMARQIDVGSQTQTQHTQVFTVKHDSSINDIQKELDITAP